MTTLDRGLENGSTNDPLDLKATSLPVHMTLAAFTGIAWYNVIELNVSVYMTFKRKRGLYFWSVLASIWGIALHSIAFVLKLYGVISVYQITVTMITIGWYAMVTGQSLVLYSRLHLVVQERRIIRAVLIMILVNAVTMHFPTTVLTYGSHSSQWRDFHKGFRVMEKLQMTVFCVQELIISGIYIWATLRFLRPAYRRHIRSVMLQLLWINIAIIVMDLAMLTMEYMGKYYLEAVMKGAIYSVKLKLEFAVLNQLMQIASSSRNHALRPGDSQKTTSPSPEGRNGIHSNNVNKNRRRNRRRSSATNTRAGVRGFFQRFLPGPIPNAVDDNNYFISPSVLQSVHSTRHHQQQRNVTGQYNASMGGLAPDPPERGIALTTEIRQEVSSCSDIREPARDDLDKATFLHSEGHTRNPSLENVARDRGISVESGGTGQNSEVELVDLPSPCSERIARSVHYSEDLTVPEPTARSWSTRSYSNTGSRPEHRGPNPKILSSSRPSIANLRDDRRSSSEENLRT